MIDKIQVLDIIRKNGPVIPRDLVKELGGDTFFVGAVLSELVQGKEIMISNTKIGGSPVYYVSGQEQKLVDLYDYLHEKEKKAFDILKSKKILRDKALEPVLRVALRSIKDFAKPLEVHIKDNKELFWKWYLFSNEEAEKIIRDIIKKEYVKEPAQKIPKQIKEKPKEEPKGDKPRDKKIEKIDKPQTQIEGTLHERARKAFDKVDLTIIEESVIRKNSEIEMVVELPSAVGILTYFCKVRNKKRSNDKDLSDVFVKAQMKKLPALYVTTGELTKKAQEMLNNEFKMIAIFKI